MEKSPDVSILNNFCHFLFPFYHRFSDLSKADNLDNWQKWQKRLDKTEIGYARDSTLYFQPFVRQMLFPEFCCRDQADMKPYRTRHITFMMDNHAFSSDFDMQTISPNGIPDGRPYKGKIHWVDTYLFPEQIGILVMAISFSEEDITLHQLADRLWATRIVLPPFAGFNLPRLNLSNTLGDRKIEYLRDFIDRLIEPLIDIQFLGGKEGDTYTQTPVGEEEGERCYIHT